MRTKHILGILILLTFVAPAVPAYAGGVVTVCDEAHLRAALTGGGTVTFTCSGTITLTDPITIAADTTIDGSGQDVTISGNYAVRVFTVNPEISLALNALTVADGNATGHGGGIYIATCSVDCDDVAVTVSNSTFSSNSASGDGGGIFVSPYCYENCGDMTVTVSNSNFNGNSANGYGGGIFHDGDYMSELVTLIVSNSSFSGNTAQAAGAIFSGNDTTLTVSDSIFSGNSGSAIRTAIYSYATLTVSNSTFSNNSGSGIINSKWNALAVSNSTFSNNSHCGIDNYDAHLAVSNSTFSGNTYCGISNGDDGGMATISNCTFSNNGAVDSNGGDIQNAIMGMTVVSNSTISSNRTSHIGGIFNGVEGTMTVSNSTVFGVRVVNSDYGGTLTLKNTIVANGPTGGNCSGSITDGGGNLSYPDTTCPGINADPLLGPLQYDVGSTETMALGPGSAAIDAANDTTCAAAPVNNLDQRGIARPWGPHCDIGAVEQAPLKRIWFPTVRSW